MAKKVIKMSEKVATRILSGVVKVTSYFTSSIANSKAPARSFLVYCLERLFLLHLMDLKRIMWFHCRRLVIGDTMADFILDPHNADVLKARILVVEITNTLTVPEIAFTEDTMADFILDPHNADVLKARIFVVEEQGKHADKELTYHYVCSFLEIYNEQITDLLDPSPKSLQIREDVRTACVYVESLTKELVFTTKDVTQLSVKGLSNRRTGATSANADSSRLHCVFTCVIKSESKALCHFYFSKS